MLGYADIDVMKASMSHRSYLGWQQFYREEPWGPWRDNMHTAILAREMRRSGGGGNPSLDTFMLRTAESRSRDVEQKVVSTLGAMAVPVTQKEAHRRMKMAKAKRKKAPSKRRGREKVSG